MMDDEIEPDEYVIPDWLRFNSRPPLNLTLGTPRTGLWCETCLLPSHYEVPVYMLGADGPYEVGAFDRCKGCNP